MICPTNYYRVKTELHSDTHGLHSVNNCPSHEE